ncbi:MAG TPA: hypothetical protein VF074_02105 [Pyrinomonadaceae bacterium]
MKYFRIPLVLSLTFVLAAIAPLASFATGAYHSQGQSTALERGYRTGYSDGYNAGFRDITEKAPRDFQNKGEYQNADRSYNEAWGPVEDYRDGYQQGFEKGYTAGYDRKLFDSTIPADFKRRGTVTVETSPADSSTTTTPDSSQPTDTTAPPVGASGSWSIPRDTVLMLELITPLSTDATQIGDRFQARVVEPSQFAGGVVEGRVSQVRRPGKVKGVAELQLTFEQIRWQDNRSSSFHAQLIEVMPMGRDVDPEVDREGGVRGPSTTKDDVTKVGAATGIGAIIGAIAGGGKGAAIGAVIGGSVGTAGVMSQRGKDIRLERGQQLKVRTSTDTASL